VKREYIEVPVDFIKELGNYNDAVVLNYIRKQMVHECGMLLNDWVIVKYRDLADNTYLSGNEVAYSVQRLTDDGYIRTRIEEFKGVKVKRYSFVFGSI